MGVVLKTKDAVGSLIDIGKYIAKQCQDIESAMTVLDEIEAKCIQYAEFPMMGQTDADFPSSCRWFSVHNFCVIYQPREDGIVVLLVTHNSRDIPSMLNDLIA